MMGGCINSHLYDYRIIINEKSSHRGLLFFYPKIYKGEPNMPKQIYQERRFTDQQLQQANSINILDYARSRGYPVDKVSSSAYKIPGHGGLYINADGQKWNWFSQNKGGGVIQFVMEMEKLSWVEAIKQLIGDRDNIVDSKLKKIDAIITPAVSQSQTIHKSEFILPEKNNTYNHMLAYLINSRCIDKDIVYQFIKQGKLYENKQRSCVFVGFDNTGQARYASARSTNTYGKIYKFDVANSDKAYPFNYKCKDDTVCVFESPIDLMSYLTITQKYFNEDFTHHCISLGGVSDKALENYLKQNNQIKSIMLCLDNDEAGHFACQQIIQKYKGEYDITENYPVAKDFNEDLITLQTAQNRCVSREEEDEYECSL